MTMKHKTLKINITSINITTMMILKMKKKKKDTITMIMIMIMAIVTIAAIRIIIMPLNLLSRETKRSKANMIISMPMAIELIIITITKMMKNTDITTIMIIHRKRLRKIRRKSP